MATKRTDLCKARARKDKAAVKAAGTVQAAIAANLAALASAKVA